MQKQGILCVFFLCFSDDSRASREGILTGPKAKEYRRLSDPCYPSRQLSRQSDNAGWNDEFLPFDAFYPPALRERLCIEILSSDIQRGWSPKSGRHSGLSHCLFRHQREVRNSDTPASQFSLSTNQIIEAIRDTILFPNVVSRMHDDGCLAIYGNFYESIGISGGNGDSCHTLVVIVRDHSFRSAYPSPVQGQS